MNIEAKTPITFAEFELDAERRQLRREGKIIQLKAKAFDVLIFLAENAGRVVTKDEILKGVWENQFVEEANLAVQISALRKALNDKKDEPRFLITVPGKGYKFIADIETDEEIVIENHKFSSFVIEENEGDAGTERRGDAGIQRAKEISQKTEIHRVAASPRLSVSFSKIIAFVLISATTILALWFWRGSGNQNSALKQPKMSLLTTSGKVSAVALAPDGRFAVFSQKESDGESLWLRQIETGSQTRIAQSRKIEYFALSISPDGNYVYASVYLENQSEPPLWKIPILGGAVEEIPNVVTSAAISFSPDGKNIAYTESHRPETHLLIADANGENERVLLRANRDRRFFPFEQNNPTAWSPDGKNIAVVFHEQNANGSLAGVLLVDPTDGRERILVSPKWTFVDNIAWLDAETLAFTGYEDEWTNQIWTISRKTGETRQITNNLQKYHWLTASGGNLLTAQVGAVSNIYAADFSEESETISPRGILRESGYVSYVGWSRSGEVFYSSRTTGKVEVWRVNKNGSNAAQITSGANIIYGLAVSPSDGSLIFPSNQDGRITIQKADADGRNPRFISDGAEQIFPDIASDGTIVFQEGDYKISILAPNEKTSVQIARGIKPTISPDGRQVAFFVMDENKWRIHIAEKTTGEVVRKLNLPTNVKERRMRWHPSGKFLTLIYNAGETLTLLLLPVDGGRPRSIGNLGKGEINSFAWSADGKQIIYSVTNETQDVVRLSDF